MPVLKCKICGGDIEVNQDMTIGTCMYCGSTVTLPKINSEKKIRLFNRANQYRIDCEFDKAYSVYEAISQEDEQEAEAYWGMLLSEYGVEYVEDPKSMKRVPTCHRTKIKSITSSENYKNALIYADSESKFLYQDEAEDLDKLQKNIISVSAKEKPYDVFICYKETDDQTGQRTQDSILAQKIYEELEDKGIKTFFARISLEDKLGQNYEPFIFAALNTAKVMLLVTSSNENCNAIWVKNEWMRFIQFMEEDKNKNIIPVCHQMSPYELPDELTSFQAQDIDKVGAIQDLVYGINKLLGKAPRESNNQIINELLDEKVIREKKTQFVNRLLISTLIVVAVGFSFMCYWLPNTFSNGYTSFSNVDMAKKYMSIMAPFSCLLILSAICGASGVLTGLIRGYTKPLAKRSFFVGLVLFTAAVVNIRFNGFLVPGISFISIVYTLIAISITFMQFKNDLRFEFIGRLVIIILSVFLLFTNIGFTKKEISNHDIVNNKNQIIVSEKFANIRQSATTESEIVGEVYNGMVFDVIGRENNGKYEWIKICTAEGVNGYIRSDLVFEPIEIEIMEDYANVRERSDTACKIIGKVYKGDKFYAIQKTKGYRPWYKIYYDGQNKGWIGIEGIKEH